MNFNNSLDNVIEHYEKLIKETEVLIKENEFLIRTNDPFNFSQLRWKQENIEYRQLLVKWLKELKKHKLSSATKNDISNKSISYKTKESKEEIQDLSALEQRVYQLEQKIEHMADVGDMVEVEWHIYGDVYERRNVVIKGIAKAHRYEVEE